MASKPAQYTVALIGLIAGLVFVVSAGFVLLGAVYQLSLRDQLALQAAAAIIIALAIGWVIVGINPIIKEILATFRVMTRLESLSHPLLMRLSHEAPGTYHHSLQVGTLASRAARVIGADPLLARLGGYYHDIGKLTKPTYFIENQQGGKNPLDAMSPRQAARVIIAHIDDGLAIAQEYRLPAEVLAFVPQHTGTTLVRYFYEQAKLRSTRVNPDDFQYPGPKPQSRETGIVMLADSIEAKARLLVERDRRAITKLVDETIAQKTAERQLELAGFQPDDLRLVRESFIDTLVTMMHQRIAYPTTTNQQYNEGAL